MTSDLKNQNILITTDAWFTAPDGKMYRSVWGVVEIHNDNSLLGVKTNARSTNWYAIVGRGDTRVIIAGCQIHYACVCPNPPNLNPVLESRVHELKSASVERDNMIYLAQ